MRTKRQSAMGMRRNILALAAGLLLSLGQRASAGSSDTIQRSPSLEFLPILSYDTDAGLGYGLKVFSLNRLQIGESVDLVCFNSTKGERWYKLVISLPDFDLRQGTIYTAAVDLTIDYDKWISYRFFGIGNSSRSADKEEYTRKPLEVSLMFTRGFTHELVAQAGLRYRNVQNEGLDEAGALANLSPPLNSGTVRYLSFNASLRYDSRDSYTNPSRGLVLGAELEHAPIATGNIDFTRYGLTFQFYSTPWLPKLTLGLRCGIQVLGADNPPVQILLPVGGGTTLRGYPQDRYLDKVAALLNAELRFPLFWRFGGVAGFDAGKVWSSPREMDLARWASNPVIGLRFYFDTFIVRMDLGISSESTGFYLNFGQVF